MKLTSLLNRAKTIFDRIVVWVAVLAAVILVFEMLSISSEVTQRYLFNRTTLWLLEVNEYGLLFFTLLSSAWVLRKNGHVRIDLILAFFSPKNQALVNAITFIIAATVFFIIGFYGIQTTLRVFQLGFYEDSILSPPKWVLLTVIPFGCFLLFIELLIQVYNFLKGWRTLSNQGMKQ
ncbi:TRAP transporter small permease subunit [Chloroflexota bacterium]